MEGVQQGSSIPGPQHLGCRTMPGPDLDWRKELCCALSQSKLGMHDSVASLPWLQGELSTHGPSARLHMSSLPQLRSKLCMCGPITGLCMPTLLWLSLLRVCSCHFGMLYINLYPHLYTRYKRSAITYPMICMETNSGSPIETRDF